MTDRRICVVSDRDDGHGDLRGDANVACVLGAPRNMTLEVLRALAHPLRLKLVAHIAASGPLCSCHLEETVGASQPQISKHLSVLNRAGLLHRRREGRWVYYSIDRDALDVATEFLDALQRSLHRPHLADSCDDDGDPR